MTHTMTIFNNNRKFILSQLLGAVRKGFLLMELVMTLLMISLFMTVIIHYQFLHLQWRSEAEKRMRALNKATTLIEEFFYNPASFTTKIYNEDGLTIHIEILKKKGQDFGITAHMKAVIDMFIKVTITWVTLMQEQEKVILESAAWV